MRACAVEMHMDISQGNFCARIYSEKAGDQMEYPDLAPAINTYRNSADTLFGEWFSIARFDNTKIATEKEAEGPDTTQQMVSRIKVADMPAASQMI